MKILEGSRDPPRPCGEQESGSTPAAFLGPVLSGWAFPEALLAAEGLLSLRCGPWPPFSPAGWPVACALLCAGASCPSWAAPVPSILPAVHKARMPHWRQDWTRDPACSARGLGGFWSQGSREHWSHPVSLLSLLCSQPLLQVHVNRRKAASRRGAFVSPAPGEITLIMD